MAYSVPIWRSFARAFHVDKTTGKIKFDESTQKPIVTCKLPDKIALTFSGIMESEFPCAYAAEESCSFSLPWVNPNRTFTLSKISDVMGLAAYECNDASFMTMLAMRYIGDARYFYIHLYRRYLHEGGYCHCPIFMCGWESLFLSWRSDSYNPIVANASFIVGNIGEGSKGDYLCIKDRRAWTDYGTWNGINLDNVAEWQSDFQYYGGAKVWGTDGKVYIAKTEIQTVTSCENNKPVTGEFWDDYWGSPSLSYSHGRDIVEGTDGKKYYCRTLHTSDTVNRPVSGGSWAGKWGLVNDYSSSTTYPNGTSVHYDGYIVRSRYIYTGANVGHTPDVHNSQCHYDYWWEVLDNHTFKNWSSNTLFATAGTSRVLGTDGNGYKCIKVHAPFSNNRPVTGENWAEYWELESTPNVPEVDANWKEYWAKIKCSLPVQEGVFFTNHDAEFNVGVWGRVVVSSNLPEVQYWEEGRGYNVGDMVRGTDGLVYACEISHTSEFDNAPITGKNWDDYWIKAECSQ